MWGIIEKFSRKVSEVSWSNQCWFGGLGSILEKLPRLALVVQNWQKVLNLVLCYQAEIFFIFQFYFCWDFFRREFFFRIYLGDFVRGLRKSNFGEKVIWKLKGHWDYLGDFFEFGQSWGDY